MKLSDFFPDMEGFVSAESPVAKTPQIPNPETQISPFSRAPLPLPMQYSGDTIKQYNRPGLSSFRISPQSPSSFPAINSAASGVSKNTVSTSTISVIDSTPSSGGSGVTSVGLTAPSVLFFTPVPGSPVTSAGILSLVLLDEPQNFVFAGPAGTAGTIALDAALGTVTPQSAGTSQTINASGVTTQANDFALLAIGWQDGNISGSTSPDASWTSIFGFPTINTGEGLWWKSVPAAGAVSATASVTTTGNPALAATIVTAKTSGGTPAIRQSATVGNVGIGPFSSASIAYTSNVLAGTMLFMVTVQYSRFSPWAVTDSKGNIWVQISSTSIQTPNGGFPNNVRTQTIWATPSGSAGPNTVTIQSTFTAALSASFYIIEVTNLAAPVRTPIFRALAPADIPGMSTGLMSLQFGGTGANLSGTGGANQFIAQTTAGGALAPQQPAFTNLSGNIAVSQMNSGTSASASTFWRGDGTWKAPVPNELSGGTIDSGATSGNVALTTIVSPGVTGLYRVSVYMILDVAATTSSTLPDLLLQWTDGNNNTLQTIDFVAASPSANTLTTYLTGTALVYVSGVTSAIKYQIGSVTPYASVGATGMAYIYHIRVEAL